MTNHNLQSPVSGLRPPVYHVVAAAQNGVIGKDNKLPWHFSADLKFFKNLTTGHTLVMGRKTFESIGRPLPNRQNIVISRKTAQIPGAEAVHSIEAALKAAKHEKIFIIGGGEIFKQTLDLVEGIYLTLIHQDFEGDAFYPGVPAGFKEISREKLHENPLIEVIFYKAPK